jgi:mRNA interferase MazF
LVSVFQHALIIAFISSKVPDRILESDIEIKTGHPQWHATGLAVDSVIRLHKIVTIPRHLIKRRLGEANNELAILVMKKLFRMFNID